MGRRREEEEATSGAPTRLGARPGVGSSPQVDTAGAWGPPLTRGPQTAEAALTSSEEGSLIGSCTGITWGLLIPEGGARPPSLIPQIRGAWESACPAGPQGPLPGVGPLENRASGETCVFWGEAGWQAAMPRLAGGEGGDPAPRYLDALRPLGRGPARQTPRPRGSLGPGGGDLHFRGQLDLHLPFGCFHGNVDCNAGG